MRYFFLVGFIGIIFVLSLGLKEDPKIIPSNLLSEDMPKFKLSKIGHFSYFEDEKALLNESTPKIINFFASWCPPCQYEHKHLMELSKSFSIYGIAKKDDFSNINEWFERKGNPFQKIGHDIDGKVSIQWGVYGLPETFVVDSSGKIRFKHVGPITDKERLAIKDLIKNLK
tara:strand:+ start:267 stop:779 length:513 start_codon:yes stop_codon:yes gene_type:complete